MKNLFLLVSLLLSANSFAQFTSEDEVSLLTTGGNTDVKTYDIQSDNKYILDKNSFRMKGHYTFSESETVTNAENWDLTLRFDRALTETIEGFLGQGVESNRFSGFSRRYNSDLGVKYTYLKTTKNETFSELGLRYSIEEDVNDSIADTKDFKGRVYVETKQKFNDSVSGKLWIEYIPNFSESEKYLANIEPSLAVSMTKVFSLKLAYQWNYNNAPPTGNSKTDYKYTTGLLANF
ncbi:DUF481 domain-containing protein [Halobacteriovorax sp. HLS]|uniref:DUF481 domain-containing protein n=1 Tax=Halobacteriovorax sp. HLS TaxID=2234000 RepID=UPI000FD9BCE9|nr:DUF481 domain-containing protein [Halobacteriovorax sp. HLS]